MHIALQNLPPANHKSYIFHRIQFWRHSETGKMRQTIPPPRTWQNPSSSISHLWSRHFHESSKFSLSFCISRHYCPIIDTNFFEACGKNCDRKIDKLPNLSKSKPEEMNICLVSKAHSLLISLTPQG